MWNLDRWFFSGRSFLINYSQAIFVAFILTMRSYWSIFFPIDFSSHAFNILSSKTGWQVKLAGHRFLEASFFWRGCDSPELFWRQIYGFKGRFFEIGHLPPFDLISQPPAVLISCPVNKAKASLPEPWLPTDEANRSPVVWVQSARHCSAMNTTSTPYFAPSALIWG